MMTQKVKVLIIKSLKLVLIILFNLIDDDEDSDGKSTTMNRLEQ